MIFYHYTCEHGRRGIVETHLVKPNPVTLLGVPLAWFTDLPDPDRWALRLTSESVLTCDRTEYRVTVEADPKRGPIVHWPTWRRAFVADVDMPAQYRRMAKMIEEATECRPMHWWVSECPVQIVSVELTRPE